MKLFSILFSSIFILFLLSCNKKESSETGVATFIKGSVKLIRASSITDLKLGDMVRPGDTIETSAQSTAILSFAAGESEAEVQSNSTFKIESYDEKKAELSLLKGNVWFQVVNKNKKDFSLSNPTAVAGVRGTKFFTFQFDKETYGTCHCEGKVHYELLSNHEAADNDRDYMIIVRNGKSVILEPAEFAKLFPNRPGNHEHSEIANSPLGKVRSYTPEEYMRLRATIESKFAALK